MILNALNYNSYRELNEAVKSAPGGEVTIENCLGQRYIGCGLNGRRIIVNGTPGNGLGAYLDGAEITVYGNAQDAVCDTMNCGSVVIHGDCGDAAGYGMRGGSVYIKGSVGYRAGIHMKAYKDNYPVMVIGGGAGSFLAEYMAGGLVIVLGLNTQGGITGNFCATGMHGGNVLLRCDQLPSGVSSQVLVKKLSGGEFSKYHTYINNYCGYFGCDFDAVINHNYYLLSANTHQPYARLYTFN